MSEMKAKLRRSGFLLRPSLASDQMDVAEHIFGDIEVAKTLVHNVSSPEGALVATDAWIDALAADGKRNTSNHEHIGLWTIVDPSNAGRFVGIRGVFVAPGLPENSVATFVAVAKAYWGEGVSGDSSFQLCGHVFENSDVAAIYTRVWPKLNPASDAVQRRLGFEPADRHTLRETFGEQRMLEVLEFDLWRISKLENEDYAETLRQCTVRIGQLVLEQLLDVQAAERRITAALPVKIAHSSIVQDRVARWLQLGYDNPAWATYRMSRDMWTKSAHDEAK
ncbi:GNAT family N-acetyltransferase [Sulfitobacter sp. SK011]|uniref:GNAT family N-acetyltransferase n=1 Tax=Sulfitobacter sp. SK011 TaxID=1389004 RepID=UPI000E0B2338|nr:GNAT family N-acetyltransferase [Sulfitobacter sp. SK011]AXI41448.1 hypothetical protein C1J02_05380 [Sulfitobacter sp. SK011]